MNDYSTLIKKYKVAFSTIHSIYRLINSTYELEHFTVRLCGLLSQCMGALDCEVMVEEYYDDLAGGKKQKSLKYLFGYVHGSERGFKKILSRQFTEAQNKVIANTQYICENHFIAVPMILEDVVGMISLRRARTKSDFDGLDQDLILTISEQAVVAIRNIYLYKAQQKILFESIDAITTILDAKTPIQYMHSDGFSDLVLALGEAFGLSEDQLEALYFATKLHDAGKAHLPVELLTKKKALTKKEFEMIQGHPVEGAQLIRHIKRLEPVLPIILYHHERYDGTGYPEGLKEQGIPIEARIMSVADAFDAMVLGRPYKERISVEAAIDEMKKNSGTQFDPMVIDTLLQVLKKKRIKKYLQNTITQ